MPFGTFGGNMLQAKFAGDERKSYNDDSYSNQGAGANQLSFYNSSKDREVSMKD
jgi:hypothetical protein